MAQLNKTVTVNESGACNNKQRPLSGGEKSQSVHGKSMSTKSFDELARAKGVKTFK